MAFKYANPKVGDIKVLKRDLTCMKGTLLAGSRVEIIGSSYRGWDVRDVETGEEVHESMHWDIFRED